MTKGLSNIGRMSHNIWKHVLRSTQAMCVIYHLGLRQDIDLPVLATASKVKHLAHLQILRLKPGRETLAAGQLGCCTGSQDLELMREIMLRIHRKVANQSSRTCRIVQHALCVCLYVVKIQTACNLQLARERLTRGRDRTTLARIVKDCLL